MARAIFNVVLILIAGVIYSCSNQQQETATATETNLSKGGQETVVDEVSQPNVVKVAINSPDHSTLVKAVQAADLVNALSNNGPFTVFAPTNAAFAALPSGTLDDLLKPENKGKLQDILYHHVFVGIINTSQITDGMQLTMFDGSPVTFHVKDGKYMINDANIVASVPASNGIVHVIDAVQVPAAK